MTRADLHRITGVSKSAITQAVDRGRLNVGPDGQIDPDDPATIAYINEPRKNNRPNPPALETPVPQPRGGRRPAPTTPIFSPPPAAGPVAAPAPKRGAWKSQPSEGGESYKEAEKRKMIAAADLQEIKAKQLMGELVPRADVKSVFFQLQAVDGKQILSIGQRVAADVSAFFGIDDPQKVLATQEMIDAETKRALAQSKKLMDDWLADHEVEN